MAIYTALYNSLNPIDGKLAGSKVKPHMMNSKLPVDILTKVWDLSDVDQDGFLNMKEFILVTWRLCVTFHLCFQRVCVCAPFSLAILLPRPNRASCCLSNFHQSCTTLIRWKTTASQLFQSSLLYRLHHRLF